MNNPNRIEMGFLKLIIARIKSKSPAMYATLTRVAGIAAAIMLIYVSAYNAGAIPPHFILFQRFDTGVLDNICVVLGAAFTSLGLVSATTTSDPALLSPAVKANVVQEAVDKGTHAPVDISNRGNETN